MTPEKRLDQLELIMAEMLQKQDKYFGQIQFLGMNILDLAGRQSLITNRLDKIETRLDKIETRLDKIETRLDKIETRLDKIETRLDGVDTKLDMVLTILRSKNGH